MSEKNRSPLGWGVIFLLHSLLLISGVLLQNLSRYPFFLAVVGGVGVGGVFLAVRYRGFLWDVFRSFRSAVVLLFFLVLSCVMGTLFVQDLDLRREGIYAHPDDLKRGKDGKPPEFSLDRQPGMFAFCQATLLIRITGDEKLEKALAGIRLSPLEEERARQQEVAFGPRAAEAWRKSVLKGKESQLRRDITKDYAERQYDAWLYDFFLLAKSFHIFDIFEAWWFYALLGLIAVNVVGGTFAREPWNLRDFGLAVTHSGVLIILAGALLDRATAKEGYIHYVYGDPARQVSSSIYDQKNSMVTHLPFRVRLDRFATEYFHELLVERFDHTRRNDGVPWSSDAPNQNPFSVYDLYPIRQGVTRKFEDGTVSLEVERFLPRVRVLSALGKRTDGKPDPGVRLGLYNHPTQGSNLFYFSNTDPLLFAMRSDRDAVEAYDLRFEYRWAKDEGEYRRLLNEAPLPDNGHLTVGFDGQTTTVPVVARTKRTIEVGGRSFTVAFDAVESPLRRRENVNVDRRLQKVEPVLYLHIDGDEVEVPRGDWVKGYEFLHGAELRFEWPDPRESGILRLFRIVEGDGLPRVLVQRSEDGRPTASTMEIGHRIPLDGLGGFVAAEQFERSAVPSRKIEEVTDDEFLRIGGGAEDDLLAAWAKVRVKGPWGEAEAELTPFEPPLFYGPPDRPALYSFGIYRNEQLARDWFSVLTVLGHDGEVVKSHRVQVNDPLRHEGYRFYQATAGKQEGLAVSGISVTYQPGVGFMYVGYTVLTLGVSWIFFIKPMIAARQRRRREQEVAA